MLEPGSPFTLGATVVDDGVNFALFSEHAAQVALCLFDANGTRELQRFDLHRATEGVWNGFVPGLKAGQIYGYRVHGPYEPEQGHRFNPNKLLVDPYTRRLFGELQWRDEVFGFKVGHADADLSFDERDSAPFVPKSVVCAAADATVPPSHAINKSSTPLSHSIIYEAHVKGLTRQCESVPEHHRGTYAALGSDALVSHLRKLGITALELLPVHSFVDEHFATRLGLSNYWGYNSLVFFAPANRYATEDATAELASAIDALHDAGIEVLLDVVYNHTAEGDECGPTLCYRGIDNRNYYRLAEDKRFYINDTGTGNTVNMAHPRVLQLVMDSLRYWRTAMRVDGFRFDLASVLGREAAGFSSDAAFFKAMSQDPALSGAKFIAEPWDIGHDGYQLGNYPSGWSEWNDQYRDTVRRIWAGEAGLLSSFANLLLGTSERFESPLRSTHASINFICSHDGFTLEDLVSHEHKHNEANGENNHDGHNANFSSNAGVEGATDDIAVQAERAQRKRNLLTTLFVSQGVPMLLAGDEMSNSQGGNNNAYCQDNPIGWLDWAANPGVASETGFVAKLTSLKKRFAVLRNPRFLHGARQSRSGELADIMWLNASADRMSTDQWHSDQTRFLAALLVADSLLHEHGPGTDGAAPLDEYPENNHEHCVLLLFNFGTENQVFDTPRLHKRGSEHAGHWIKSVDTAAPEANEHASNGPITVSASSMVVLYSETGLVPQLPGFN